MFVSDARRLKIGQTLVLSSSDSLAGVNVRGETQIPGNGFSRGRLVMRCRVMVVGIEVVPVRQPVMIVVVDESQSGGYLAVAVAGLNSRGKFLDE